MQGFKEYISQFGIIEDNVYAELHNCFSPMDLNKDEFFTQEGQIGRKIGFLKKGIVRAYFRNSEGKEFSKQFFVGPSVIGAYASLLTSQPSSIIQQALTQCELFVAPYEDISRLYEKYHSLERIGRKIAEYYYVEKEQKLIELAVYDAERRYAIFKERFPTLEKVIPQYYIASYLGVTPTQLSRIRRRKSQP